jgi:hypothetical protein
VVDAEPPFEGGLPPIGRGLGWIASQPGGFDAFDGTVLVPVGGVAADADGADRPAVAVQDEHAARHGDELSLGGGGHRALESGPVLEPVANRARRDAHAESPACLSLGDAHAQRPAPVVALRGNDLAARVHDHHGQREHPLSPARGNGVGGDGGGLREGERGHDVAKSHDGWR